MSAPDIPQPTPAHLEGAGLFSSWADFEQARRSGGPFEIAMTAAVAGLDTLGFVADPLDSLLQAGVGWLIEHVWFLSEPLSFLAGRPTEVIALSRSWAEVSTKLALIAEARRGGAPGPVAAAPPGWEGMAGRAFQESAEAHALAIATVAAKAEELAATLVTAGASIGLVRSLVRDLIAEWASFAIKLLLLALLAAGATGGASIAATVGGVVLDAIRLANRIAEEISLLLTRLVDAGGAAGRIASAMRSTGNGIGTGVLYAHYGAQPVDDYLNSIGAGEVAEAGKQSSTAHGV